MTKTHRLNISNYLIYIELVRSISNTENNMQNNKTLQTNATNKLFNANKAYTYLLN